MALGEKSFHVEAIVVADEGERFNLGDRLIREKFMVEIGQLAGSGRAGFVVELGGVARRGESVSHRLVLADRPGSHSADIVYQVFWLSSGDRQAHEMIIAAFLHREINRAALRRPLRRPLPIVNRAPNFAAMAAVGVHDPDMRVFHGGLAIGEAAAGAAINNEFAVRRP